MRGRQYLAGGAPALSEGPGAVDALGPLPTVVRGVHARELLGGGEDVDRGAVQAGVARVIGGEAGYHSDQVGVLVALDADIRMHRQGDAPALPGSGVARWGARRGARASPGRLAARMDHVL